MPSLGLFRGDGGAAAAAAAAAAGETRCWAGRNPLATSVGVRAWFPKEGGTGRRAGREVRVGTIVPTGQARGAGNGIRLANIDVDGARGTGDARRHRRLAGQCVVGASGTWGARGIVAQTEIGAVGAGVALDRQDRPGHTKVAHGTIVAHGAVGH